MKDISLYTVMVSLKLKEKRELQNWAKKTLSQKYSDNAVKVFQKYLREKQELWKICSECLELKLY